MNVEIGAPCVRTCKYTRSVAPGTFRTRVAENLYLFFDNTYRFGVLGPLGVNLTKGIGVDMALTPLDIMRYAEWSFLECLLTFMGRNVKYDLRS